MKPCTRFHSIQTNLLDNPIEDNLLTRQFSIKLDDVRAATVNYIKVNEDTYDLVHSYIPEEYHGLGLGHLLAKRIFEHLKSNDKKFKLTCEFLQKVYDKSSQK